MLYTNAELIEVYAKAYDITKDSFFKEVAIKTINNINERFRKNDLFFSASDADSEGEEGKYFVFSYEECMEELIKNGFGKREAKKILKYFGITPFGNFENAKSNPHITNEKKPENLEKAIKIFKKIREKREYPFIDYKILTSWNSLMITSLFIAGKYIDEKYSKEALESLEKLLNSLYINGELYHQMIFDKKPKVKAILEDYAFLIESLIKAYEYTLDTKYLNQAKKFTQKSIEKFYKNGIWLISDDEFQTSAPLEDSAYKSAAAVMIKNLFIISALTGDLKLHKKAKESLKNALIYLQKFPSAHSTLLEAFLMDKIEIVLIKLKKENLLKIKNQNINRPFVYLLPSDEEKYLGCYIDRCFVCKESFEEIEDQINFNTKRASL